MSKRGENKVKKDEEKKEKEKKEEMEEGKRQGSGCGERIDKLVSIEF